ncbi:MAG: hypothetical protein KDA84_10200 [Planctomycetaceae bacterium]|nr:hypothetical protein [Planctomycetaceae bacterium]
MARTHSTKKKRPQKAKKGRRIPRKPTKRLLKTLHERFEAFLQRLRVYIRMELRRSFWRDYEDIVQECTAIAWRSYLRLALRGIDGSRFVSKLAHYAVRSVRNGRRIAGGVRRNDVFVWQTQTRCSFCVRALVVRSDSAKTGWRELVIEDKRTTPADVVVCRLDFEAWLKSLPRRKRRIAEVLSESHSTKDTAKRFHLTWGRISQLRRELADSWWEFQRADDVNCESGGCF